VSLHLVPITFADACGFVEMWHRHHVAPVGHKFSVGVADLGLLRGVAIVGRPVARSFDDGMTLEVTRTATDGTPNANSMLYAAAWQATKALGYRRLFTYTYSRFYGPTCDFACDHLSCQAIRVGESGASLRGAGYRMVAERKPRPGWNVPSRPRSLNGTEGIARTLWEAS
jgi:hypothetical protein